MHKLGCAGRVGVAYCADLEGDDVGSATPQLICHDPWPDRGDPIELLIARKIFKWQERDALRRISSPGAGSA